MVFLDDHVLMALPEMYRHSKKHEYFGTKLFLAYMLEATAQSAIIFFLILYAYVTTTSRRDGYDVYIDEFSTVSIECQRASQTYISLDMAHCRPWPSLLS